MIFHQHKLIFCHIPRTGGSTISKVLNGGETYYIEHKTKEQYKASLPAALIKQYKFFTIVRNPFARMVSLFARDNKNMIDNPAYFQDWTRRLLSQIEEQKVMAQVLYTKGFTKDDLILKHENLANDCRDMLGIEIGEEKLHTTQHRELSFYYTPESEDLMREYYNEDFVKFGYSTTL